MIGASAIEEDGTLLDYDPREVRVAQAIISHARSVILVADSTKFDRNAPIRIVDIPSVDFFVTDRMPPPAFTAICKEQGITLLVATGKGRCDVVVDHRKGEE